MNCSMCGAVETPARLRDAHAWRFWERDDGACPACVQEALLRTLLDEGDAALHAAVQRVWPLDAESAFGALPTPLRLHAHPRFRGRGTTVAMIDSGFAPHPDLVRPHNRIRAWVDPSETPARVCLFAPDETPAWPESDQPHDWMWHGTMTSVVAAGNGFSSHGLYRGLASEADLVLVSARGDDGSITNASIARALEWLREHGPGLGVGVVNISVGGDPSDPDQQDLVDASIRHLVAHGICVVAAAGNSGERNLVPPANAEHAITVGGIDDHNMFDHATTQLWHSNYGPIVAMSDPTGLVDSIPGSVFKPELVAPSMWVAAPVLPRSAIASQARVLFELRRDGIRDGDAEIDRLKLITEHYQHVEGTSFAAPVVTSAVACMLEANPGLRPQRIKELLQRTASPVAGAPLERQGAGVLDAGRAVAIAAGELHCGRWESPKRGPAGVEFHYHDATARQVCVVGSWCAWAPPGIPLGQCAPGWWCSGTQPIPKGMHAYKFLVDDTFWFDDPANPRKQPDGLGGFNTLVEV